MAKITDLKFAYQAFMRAYPYRKVDWHPGARLEKPLSEARVAVVTTAAFFRRDQPPFDTTIRGGDHSYRVIPADTDLRTLQIAHRSDAFDIRGITSDKNLALPLDRLKSLAEEGVIGSVAPRHYQRCFGQVLPTRLLLHWHHAQPERN